MPEMNAHTGILVTICFGAFLFTNPSNKHARDGALAAKRAHRNGDVIERRATVGETRQRKFVSRNSMTLIDRKLVVDDREIEMTSLDEVTPSTTEFSYALVDRIQEVDSGRPSKFVRTYDTLASSKAGGLGAGVDSEPVKLESELAGQDVVFALDAAIGDYKASFPADSDADATLLVRLVADLDFAALLPGQGVERGDEWDLSLSLLDELISPGGDLKLRPVETDDEERGPWVDSSAVEPHREGTFKAKLVAVRVVEGTRTADIELNLEVTSTTVLTDTLEPTTEDMAGSEMHITPIEAWIERKYEGNGTLVWDIGRGRLASLTLDADVVETSFSAVEVEYNGGVTRQSHTMTSEGALECRHTIE